MSDPSASGDGVPATLRTAAGITWRVLILLVGLAVLVAVLDAVFPVVFALFFALLVTAWTMPLMGLLGRWLPRVVSMVLALLAIIAAIIAILGIVVSSTIQEGPKLVASVQDGLVQIEQWLRTGPLHLDESQFTSLISQVQQWGQSIATGLLGDAVSAIGSIGTVIIAGSVLIFAVIFFLLSPQQIWDWLVGWLPTPVRHHVDVSGRIAWDSISGYTRGIVVVALLDAVLVYIGLLILQVPLAPALAAVVFLGAFVPVIGAPIATFFAAVVALAERGPLVAVLVIALTVVVGSFDGDVLQPLVMGKAVNLHPLAIVIAIAAGSIAMGIVGALVAVPIAGAAYGVAKYLTGRDPEHPMVTAPAVMG